MCVVASTIGHWSYAMSIRRPVVQFALAALAVVAFFLAGSLFVLQRIGQSEAVRDARQFAVLSGQGIVEPALRDGVLSGDDESIVVLDQVVQERVLSERVVRVKVWTRDGRVVYSDEPRLIGYGSALDESKLEVLETGNARSERSDLDAAREPLRAGIRRAVRGLSPRTDSDGTPLLFETYQRASAVEATGRRIWVPFAVLVLGCLLLLWLVQIPLAHRLARRLERSQHEREELLERSLEASADERRRIAADLHDGVVQELVGISYSLQRRCRTRGRSIPPDETRATVQRGGERDARDDATSSDRCLSRSIRRTCAPQGSRRPYGCSRRASPHPACDVTLDVGDERLPQDIELLFYRAASEALRNVERHADASHVRVGVSSAQDGVARLEVVDDGVGLHD